MPEEPKITYVQYRREESDTPPEQRRNVLAALRRGDTSAADPVVAKKPGLLVVHQDGGSPVYFSAVAITRPDGCDYCGRLCRAGFLLYDTKADPPTAARMCADEFVMNLVLGYLRPVLPAVAEASEDGPRTVVAPGELLGSVWEHALIARTARDKDDRACAAELALEAFEALDAHLSAGGPLPDAWDGSEREPEPEPAWMPVHLKSGRDQAAHPLRPLLVWSEAGETVSAAGQHEPVPEHRDGAYRMPPSGPNAPSEGGDTPTDYPRTPCGCGYDIVYTPEGWQHDVAPWFCGDDHAPDPSAEDDAKAEDFQARYDAWLSAGGPGKINDHSNDLGDWCPWSLTLVSPDYPDDRCPAGCRGSYIEDAPGSAA